MGIRVKYFGILTDITGNYEELIDLDSVVVSDLLEFLFKKYPELQTKEFQVAVNQEIANPNTEIRGSEVALLPPFSGG